jgi:pimeloyl-ACP methyl ester carboxylesterase
MDLRGHGLSHKPLATEDFTLERLTRDAVELLDHLGIGRAHVAGNSAAATSRSRWRSTTPTAASAW